MFAYMSPRRREKEAKILFREIRAPSSGKKTDTQEAQRTPNKMSPRRSTPRHT